MDKEILLYVLVYIYAYIYIMDPEGIKWNKSHKERQILYDLFFYGVFQKNKWNSNKTQAQRCKEQIGDYQRQSYMDVENMCGVWVCACVCLLAQLYSTVCNPMHCSLPGASVYGIF